MKKPNANSKSAVNASSASTQIIQQRIRDAIQGLVEDGDGADGKVLYGTLLAVQERVSGNRQSIGEFQVDSDQIAEWRQKFSNAIKALEDAILAVNDLPPIGDGNQLWLEAYYLQINEGA